MARAHVDGRLDPQPHDAPSAIHPDGAMAPRADGRQRIPRRASRATSIPLEARIVAIANRFDELRHTAKTSRATTPLERLREEGVGRRVRPAAARRRSRSRSATNRSYRRTPRPRDHAPDSTPRILCVDDSRTNRELITATLIGSRASTVAARGERPRKAIDMLETRADRRGLLDLVMPVQDGRHALSRFAKDPRYEFLPVIVLTAHRNDATAAAGDRRGRGRLPQLSAQPARADRRASARCCASRTTTPTSSRART